MTGTFWKTYEAWTLHRREWTARTAIAFGRLYLALEGRQWIS